jgi:uncharacterized protein YqjF (DUF2071 family)
MYQEWRCLTFLHWSFDPGVIRPLVPREFELDLFDGRAWIGVVPFLIQGSRFPGIPWRIDVPETNVRTYVRAPDGQTGVWFFSLDAASALAVAGARVSFGLPYMWSKMQVEAAENRIHYHSKRIVPATPAALDCRVEVGAPIADEAIGALEVFLINRYRLYTRLFDRIAFAEVDHPPYPLAQVKLIECRHSLFDVSGAPDAIHYSPGVDVRIGRPHFIPQR